MGRKNDSRLLSKERGSLGLACRAPDSQPRVLPTSQCFPGCLSRKHLTDSAHFSGGKTETRQPLRQWRVALSKRQCLFFQRFQGWEGNQAFPSPAPGGRMMHGECSLYVLCVKQIFSSLWGQGEWACQGGPGQSSRPISEARALYEMPGELRQYPDPKEGLFAV